MDIDRNYVLETTKKLMEVDSPSGYTSKVMGVVQGLVEQLGYEFSRTKKGNGFVNLKREALMNVALCAHVDTLGLMVRSIKPNGMLAVTSIGGLIIPTLDGEYCRVYTRDDRCYTGTILCTSPSVHVYKDARTKERNESNIEIRIDEILKTDDEVLELGIRAGDIICIDPKTEITPSGFIKSRFLDDKLSVAILLGVLKYYKDAMIMPQANTYFLFSTYEEVSHGMAHIPLPMDEFIAVDMGCIGDDLTCTEYDVSICAKDSSGPYDYELVSRLIKLAKTNNISHAVDVYPHYVSDITAALRAGNDIVGALIGPGVHASHGMERSHWLAVENSIKLIISYLNFNEDTIE